MLIFGFASLIGVLEKVVASAITKRDILRERKKPGPSIEKELTMRQLEFLLRVSFTGSNVSAENVQDGQSSCRDGRGQK